MKRFLSLLLGLAAFTGVQAQDSDVGYPESVWLENPDIVLSGQEVKFIAVQFSPDSDNINKKMTWTASEEGIVEIRDIGGTGYFWLEGINFGTTTITGTTVNGLEVTGTVTVKGIIFDNYDYSMSIGQSVSLGIRTSSSEIENTLSWDITNPTAVSVSQDGIMTALNGGQTIVCAIGYENGTRYRTYAAVTVYPKAGSVALSESSFNMMPNYSYSVCVVLPEGEDNYDGTWSTSDENVIRIDEISENNCYISSVSPGKAVVTFTSVNGASASCVVTVFNSINDFTLNAEDVSLGTGDTFQIEILSTDPTEHGQSFNYNSENENVAIVDENGLITAVGYGETNITVSPQFTGPSKSITVYVSNEPFEVTLSETEVYLHFLNTKQLTATVTPSDREVEITWSSSDPRAVSVDEIGVISANGTGYATITVTATDKNGVSVSAFCVVYVIVNSGVEEILEDGETCDVYTVDGIFLKKNASTDDLKTLTNGIYIIYKGTKTFKIKI